MLYWPPVLFGPRLPQRFQLFVSGPSVVRQGKRDCLRGGNNYRRPSVVRNGSIFCPSTVWPRTGKRAEVIVGETACDYDEFYQDQKTPEANSEGEISVISFDGKGVPVIKKRQKKKEALVGVSYTRDPKPRTAGEVADNLVYPENNQGRNSAEEKREKQVKAQNVRRMARLERSQKEVMEEIIRDSQSRNISSGHPLIYILDRALGLWNLAGLLLI